MGQPCTAVAVDARLRSASEENFMVGMKGTGKSLGTRRDCS